MCVIKENETVLFQGDSVTDSLRIRESATDLGRGYPSLIAAKLGAENPSKSFKFFNRGVGGDRVNHLVSRWEEDCLKLNPDFLSILVGINNVIGKSVLNEYTPNDRFRSDYRFLLDSALKQNDKLKIVILEPFYYPQLKGAPFFMEQWEEDFTEKLNVIRKLSIEYRTYYVPTSGIFMNAVIKQDPTYFLPDGIHPSHVGHGLIAEAWLNAVK